MSAVALNVTVTQTESPTIDDGTVHDSAEQEQALSTNITAVDAHHAEATQAQNKQSIPADAFEQAVALLQDPLFD